MKKLLLIITLIVAGFTVKAQKGVPSEVISAFSQKYPDINNDKVYWDREGNNYKASFSMKEKDHEVLFDNKGQWITSEIEDLSFAELPKDVQKKLNEKGYGSDKLKDIEMSETQDETTYKVEVKDSRLKHHNVYLDEDGKIIREDI
jgi:hypothetical protein